MRGDDDAQEILALLAVLDDDQIDDLVDELPPQLLAQYLALVGGDPDAVAADRVPPTPLEQGRELDAGYVPRPHLEYLSNRLAAAVADVEAGQTRHLVISMPPRMGKSQLTSYLLTLWLLRKHPAWKIGLISHSDHLATSWGRAVRRAIEDSTNDLGGLALARDAGAAMQWETTKGGSVVSRSVGQSITGLGFKVMLVDDAVKDFIAAHSQSQREAQWAWWTSVAYTRLEPPALVIVIGCLTAESPVLLADGTERPISDVRPGDVVMTYEDGRWTTAPIVNWANVGPDHVYTLRMESGREVRGNAKHPFLVMTEEGEQWRRMDSLRPGDRIVAMPAGEHGAERPARPKGATVPSQPKGSASSTTTPPAGPQGTDATPPSRPAEPTSATDTASTPKTTTGCSQSRAVSALSADASQLPRTLDARESCSPTTAMTPGECGGSCATTATSSSATGQPSSGWSPPSPTSDVVASLTLTGYEDVYDIEVERTHNFVVNGLSTHNTRWHEDDIIGRILSTEYQGDPADWEVISFPALAEEDDVLGRSPGQPLLSPLLRETPEQAVSRWEKLRTTLGAYTWAALYQQRPAPAQGAIFDMDCLRYWTIDPANATENGEVVYLDPRTLGRGSGAEWVDSWDMAFKGEETSDYVVGQRWVRHGATRYLIEQARGRWSFTQTLERVKEWVTGEDTLESPYGDLVQRRLVEEAANGAAILSSLHNKVSGMRAVRADRSKVARARAITPEWESGHVRLPFPGDPGKRWVSDFLIPELRNFPHDAHDDQVDALTQALGHLQDGAPGVAALSVPGRAPGRAAPPSRDRSRAAATTRRR